MNDNPMPTENSILLTDESGLGFVYLLKRKINASIIKIGYTAKQAESRAVNYTDGEWIVHKEYSMPVWLAKMTERSAHQKLGQYWLDPKLTGGSASEVFICSLEHGEIAIQLAYIEQLEKSLKLLGLPSALSNIILKERGLSNEITISSIEEGLMSLANDGRSENRNLIKRIAELVDEEKKHRDLATQKIQLCQADNKILAKQIISLEADINILREKINLSIIDFHDDIKILEKYSDKKINVRDFEVLRNNFRKAMEIISRLRLHINSDT